MRKMFGLGELDTAMRGTLIYNILLRSHCHHRVGLAGRFHHPRGGKRQWSEPTAIGLCTDQLTATTLRQIYAQLHPETRSLLLGQALKTNVLTNIYPEAAEALHAQKPVVVLESTVITRGMPTR